MITKKLEAIRSYVWEMQNAVNCRLYREEDPDFKYLQNALKVTEQELEKLIEDKP